MAVWMRFVLVSSVLLLLLVPELHCDEDDAAAAAISSRQQQLHRRRFRKVRRHRVGDNADKGNEVTYQTSRVASTSRRRGGAASRRFRRPYPARRRVAPAAGPGQARRSADEVPSSSPASTGTRHTVSRTSFLRNAQSSTGSEDGPPRVLLGSYFDENGRWPGGDGQYFGWNGDRGAGGAAAAGSRRQYSAASNYSYTRQESSSSAGRSGYAAASDLTQRGSADNRNAVRRTLPVDRVHVATHHSSIQQPVSSGRQVTTRNRTVVRNRKIITTTSLLNPSEVSSTSSSAYINPSLPYSSDSVLGTGSSSVAGGSSSSSSYVFSSSGSGGGGVDPEQRHRTEVNRVGGGGRGGGSRTTTTVRREEVHSAAELRSAYIERNRLERFGECSCNLLGTDTAAGPCDASSGQCHCLPNVMGRQCDRCVPNHWQIAIGNGCEHCLCDSVGSSDEQCNEYDGQCRCRPGFGGRRCDQCEDLYWGDPRRQCRPCECDSVGSASAQCDRSVGHCPCRPGIGGPRCDTCARGHRGQAPDCRACGECFDNWDRILTELQERTEYLVSEASKIKQGGAAGAYQTEFEQMERWLEDVRQMLGNATVTDQQVDRLQAIIDEVRTNLTISDGRLKSVESSVDNTTHRVLLAELQVPALRSRAASLRRAATVLQENATLLQEANVDGALSLTREAQRRSKAAEFSVVDTERTLGEAERQRRRTENLLNRAGQQFNESLTPNQLLVDEVDAKLSAFEREMPAINFQVCDGAGDPCDALCGGAGCGKCGGLSCDEGAVTRASNALSVAKDAANILSERERQVDELLRGVTSAKRSADEAYSLAQMAFTGAELNNNRTQETQRRVEQLLLEIDQFLSNEGATPQAIRELAQQVLDMSISLRPEQITQLARQINETISSLTNIDAILAETADDLAMANELKRRADQAKLSAEAILETAESVMKALDVAETAQIAARDAMGSAETNIQLAEADLTSISSEAGAAQRLANESLTNVNILQSRQKELIKEFARNELNVKGAVKEATLAVELASEAQQGVGGLETAYQQAVELLASKSAASSSARERAQDLLDRANKLASLALGQVNELDEMNVEFTLHEELLVDLSDEVDALNGRMDSYLQVITERAEHYRTCQS